MTDDLAPAPAPVTASPRVSSASTSGGVHLTRASDVSSPSASAGVLATRDSGDPSASASDEVHFTRASGGIFVEKIVALVPQIREEWMCFSEGPKRGTDESLGDIVEAAQSPPHKRIVGVPVHERQEHIAEAIRVAQLGVVIRMD